MISQLYPLGHFLLAIAELFLIGWSIRLWLQSNSLAMVVLPIILISLSFDNLVLAGGTLIGEGDLLELLSQIRFLVHYLFLPFLIVVGIELANRAGAGWAIPIVRIFAWLLALGLGITDIVTRYIGLELKPVYFTGMLRYTTEQTTPPIITIIVTIFVLLIGLGFWIRTKGKWSWLFFGTLVALIGNALPISQFGTLIGSSSEFLMTVALLFTERYSERQLPDLGLDPDSDLLFKYIYSNWVLIHPEPKGVVYFIGGAGFGSFPTVFYRYILRRIFQEGYTIVALPFRFTLNHWSVALNLVKNAKPLREAIRAEAERLNGIHGEDSYKNLDLYSDPQKFHEGNYFWLGHSLGCKYIALLEVLGDVDRLESLCSQGDMAQISALLGECITNEKQIKKIQKVIAEIKDPDYVSLENQSSILMAPVITGIEGAIPIKAIAELVKNFIDARPSKKDTECLIKKDEKGVKDNLFHFTAIVKFKDDNVEAKAGTIQFLLDNLPTEPQKPSFKELKGKHLAPLNLLNNNEKLADLLIEWLPRLSDRVKNQNSEARIQK